MRDDMAKVLVERPRILDSVRRKGRPAPLDHLPKAVGLRRDAQEHGGFKMLNENLVPLERFLAAQEGRPWNKVYSEIAARLKPSSTVQQHVRDHLRDFVQLHPSEVVRQYAFSDRPWFQPFYVDGRDGLLKRTDRLPWARAKSRRPSGPKAPDRVALGPERELRRIDGLWFEVALAALPAPEYRNVSRPDPVAGGRGRAPRERIVRPLVTLARYDVVTGQAAPAGPDLDEPRAWAIYNRDHPQRTFAIAKRQLAHAELRRFGLRNEAG